MADYTEVTKTVMEFINGGSYVFIKCEDDSIKFIRKRGVEYQVSTDKLFRHSVLSYTDEYLVKGLINGIRGYGIYVPEDDCGNQQIGNCGCNS